MTAKEKAISLVEKYKLQLPDETHYSVINQIAIECSKIAVDEITELLCNLELIDDLKFYEEVKAELNNM